MVRGVTNVRGGYRNTSARGLNAPAYISNKRGNQNKNDSTYGYVPRFMYSRRGRILPFNVPYFHRAETGFNFMRSGNHPGYFIYHTAFPGRIRKRQNVALDRRRRRQQVGSVFSRSRRGGYEGYADAMPFIYMRQRRFRGRRRGRVGMRGNKAGRRPLTKAELDAQLDAYMGDDATKTRLDSQLDAYFGRVATHHAGNTGSNQIQGKSEPLSDPSDVPMGTPTGGQHEG